MKIVRFPGLVILSSLLVACSASGPKMAEVEGSIPAIKAGEGRVYFYRKGSMVGAAMQPEIRMNGEVVGKSVPGGFFFVDQAPGKVQVATSTEVERALSFVLDEGQTRYVRTSVGLGIMVGRVHPELVEPSVADAELAETSYIGAPLAPQ